MPSFLLHRLELTPDQLRIVELSPVDHRVVFGPPGSGKTQVLIHRAAHLRDIRGASADRFRILVFTNVLKDYIRSGLEMVNVREDSVTTFARLCADLFRVHVSHTLPWNETTRTPDFEAIQKAVLGVARSNTDLRGCFDFVLVDEGQDLDSESFEILRHLSKHVTVFADHQQQIFERGASEEQILRTFGLLRRNATLLSAYRNSPDVARLASYFIADDRLRAEYLNQIKNNHSERERPLCFMASTADEEMDRLAEVIRQRQIKNQRIGIIVPQNRQVHGFAKGLANRGIQVEKALGRTGQNHLGTPADFDNLTPKIASYHSAKGLTFDCVLLPRLCESAFPRFRGDARRRLLFVGIARGYAVGLHKYDPK